MGVTPAILRLLIRHRAAFRLPVHPCRHALLKRSTSAHCFPNESGPPAKRPPPRSAGASATQQGGTTRHRARTGVRGSAPRALTHCLDHAEAARSSSRPESPPPSTSADGPAALPPDLSTRKRGPEQTSDSHLLPRQPCTPIGAQSQVTEVLLLEPTSDMKPSSPTSPPSSFRPTSRCATPSNRIVLVYDLKPGRGSGPREQTDRQDPWQLGVEPPQAKLPR